MTTETTIPIEVEVAPPPTLPVEVTTTTTPCVPVKQEGAICDFVYGAVPAVRIEVEEIASTETYISQPVLEQTLPATGIESEIGILGFVFVAAGVLISKTARRTKVRL